MRRWKLAQQAGPIGPDLAASTTRPAPTTTAADRTTEGENQLLDLLSDTELADAAEAEQRRVEAARQRRLKWAVLAGTSREAEAGEQRTLEGGDEPRDGGREPEEAGMLEALEQHLEDIALFEVHDKDGVILEPFNSGSAGEHHKSKKAKKEYDMFADTDSEEEEEENFDELDGNNKKDRHMDFDDDEQYYRAQIGEVLYDSFKILSLMGKGVYGSVVKAQEISTERIVAIKVEFDN